VQQYSADLQRELPGEMAITVSYVGARGDHLPLGGTADTAVNINQLDPKYLALGATALNQSVANPFVGNAAFAGTSLYTAATVTRAQLLRPYPQFLNISARQVSEGVNRYNAGVVEWIRRSTRGFGGRVSYTYSVLKDNQVGESNFYTSNGSGAPLNNYNYIASLPACTTTNFAACYNPLADYGYGILDVPHRVIIQPIVQLPFGDGHRWATNGVANLLAGGWSASAIVLLQSGFPIGIGQSDNTGLLGGVQRPNLVPGVDLSTSGALADRLGSADHPTATWLNTAAFTAAAAGTFGTGPRAITAVRTPMQENVDISLAKNVRVSGSRTAQVKVEVFNLFNRVTTSSIRRRSGARRSVRLRRSRGSCG
jgi:hypothetical protein